MVVPRAGSPSSSYREISSQFAGMSLGHLEQENQVFPKQRPPGTTYTPNCTQSFSPGQPYQYMVYRHSLAAMLAQPISTQGQPTSGYLYSSPNPQAYGQPPYDQQVYNQQLYTQQPFNQSYTVGDQPLLAHQSGSHTPPTPPPSVSPMGTNPAFMSHVPTVPGATPRQQISTQVINPALSQVPARLVSPYSMPGQQLIHMPGAQQTYAYSQPYSHGQTRTTVQQSPRYKSYSEKGLPKPVDIYNPDPVNQRRPSPTCSPRGNISGSSQSRRTSGGVAGKGHGKKEGERYTDFMWSVVLLGYLLLHTKSSNINICSKKDHCVAVVLVLIIEKVYSTNRKLLGCWHYKRNMSDVISAAKIPD